MKQLEFKNPNETMNKQKYFEPNVNIASNLATANTPINHIFQFDESFSINNQNQFDSIHEIEDEYNENSDFTLSTSSLISNNFSFTFNQSDNGDFILKKENLLISINEQSDSKKSENLDEKKTDEYSIDGNFNQIVNDRDDRMHKKEYMNSSIKNNKEKMHKNGLVIK